MNRSYYTNTIVLNLKPTGENNNSVTLITPDKGVIYATLYGGPKSKLRSLVAQWHSGKIWLYDNPEKKQTKISDMEVLNYHESFGRDLFKMYAASLAAELAIKTRCAGSPELCFKLISGFLDGMELCDEEQSRLGLIRFLWRYLALMGVQPEADNDEAFAPEAVSYYNGNISSQAVGYLTAISHLEPSKVRQLSVSKDTYCELKDFVFYLISSNLGTELNTIKTGIGIL